MDMESATLQEFLILLVENRVETKVRVLEGGW